MEYTYNNEIICLANGVIINDGRKKSSWGNYKSSTTTPQIKDVIFNPPATIILWKDNTKTVVRCHKDDIYDPEYGFVMCCVKKLLGNTSHYRDIIDKWCWNNEKLNNPNHHGKMTEILDVDGKFASRDFIERQLRTFSTKRLEAGYRNKNLPKSIKRVVLDILRDRKRGIN